MHLWFQAGVEKEIVIGKVKLSKDFDCEINNKFANPKLWLFR